MAKKNSKSPFAYDSTPEFDEFLVHFDNLKSLPDPPTETEMPVQTLPELPPPPPVKIVTETDVVEKPLVTTDDVSPPELSVNNEASLRGETATLVKSPPPDTVADTSSTVHHLEPDDDKGNKPGTTTDLQLPETVLRAGSKASAVGRNSPRRSGVDKVVRGRSTVKSLDEFTDFLRGLSPSQVRGGPYMLGERKVRMAEDVGEALQTMLTYLEVTGKGSRVRVDDLVDDLLRQFITDHITHFIFMSESLLAVTSSRPNETRNNVGRGVHFV
jgi:hypothetical protein